MCFKQTILFQLSEDLGGTRNHFLLSSKVKVDRDYVVVILIVLGAVRLSQAAVSGYVLSTEVTDKLLRHAPSILSFITLMLAVGICSQPQGLSALGRIAKAIASEERS